MLDDIQMKKSNSDIPPEEKEKWILDREQEAEAISEHEKVERVIGMDEDEDGEITYYIKCTFSQSLSLAARLTPYRAGTPL